MQPFISDNHEFRTLEWLYTSFNEEEIMAMHELGTVCRNYPTLVHGLITAYMRNRCAAVRVLDIMIDVTIGAGIPFRQITKMLFINGSTTMFQVGCEMSEKSLNQILNELEERRIIWSTPHENNESLYGINLKNLMDNLDKQFKNFERTPHCMRTSRHQGALDAWLTISPKLEALNNAIAKVEPLSQVPSYMM